VGKFYQLFQFLASTTGINGFTRHTRPLAKRGSKSGYDQTYACVRNDNIAVGAFPST
jgi:hypothetical protein